MAKAFREAGVPWNASVLLCYWTLTPKRRQAGHRNIVFDIPMQLVGVPPSPGLAAERPVEHA